MCGKGREKCRKFASSLVARTVGGSTMLSKGEMLLVVVQFMMRNSNAGNRKQKEEMSGSGWNSKNGMYDDEWCGRTLSLLR